MFLYQKLQNRSLQTLLLITLYALFAQSVPLEGHRFLYTISITIKCCLVWLMPITICFFIANTIDSFEKKAPIFIMALILFESLSNLTSVCYALGSASIVSTQLSNFEVMNLRDDLRPIWELGIEKPVWWNATYGSIAGVFLGCYTAFNPYSVLKSYSEAAKNLMEWILTKIFARLIPIFVLGFLAHIYNIGLLGHMLEHYSLLSFYLICFLGIYLIFLCGVGANFNIKLMAKYIKNLLPAGGVALTSGCSLSTMPFTIKGAAANLENPKLAKAIIPATTNIQQIGDCITNSFLCFLIYKHFYGYAPDMITLSIFTLVFVLARFTTAAVIGGAIFIMLPIYENYLNFNNEMIAIILALNMLLDPIVTSTNVIANGFLCRIFEKVWNRIG